MPWLPLPRPCQLIWVWVIWFPYPPRVCYLYRCKFSFGLRPFYFYYRYCRRLWWWGGRWSLSAQTAKLAVVDASVDSASVSVESSLTPQDLLGDEKIDSSAKVNCQFVNTVATKAVADTSHAPTS